VLSDRGSEGEGEGEGEGEKGESRSRDEHGFTVAVTRRGSWTCRSIESRNLFAGGMVLASKPNERVK